MGINDTTVKNLPYNISNLTFINEFKGNQSNFDALLKFRF